MEPQDLSELRPDVGDCLTVVLMSDARATLVPVHVASHNPLTLTAAEPFKHPAMPCKALLVGANGSQTWKGEASLDSVVDGVLSISNERWERLDRRRFFRTAVQAPVSIRMVCEMEDEVSVIIANGQTEDVSQGGARIQVGQVIPLATLVEFQAVLGPGIHIRTLSIVSRHHPHGAIGLEFVDYLGSSRADLETFLALAA